MAINYDKLAEEFGGIDYDAIAGEFGGATQERVRPQIAPEEPKKSIFRRFLGELPKEAARQTIGLGAKTALSLAELPETFLKGRATQREYNVPLVGPTKSIQSEAETIGGEIIGGQKPLSAIAGPLSEAVLGPIDLALGAKGAVGLAKKTPRLVQKTVSAFAANRERKALQDALEVIRPKLSAKQQVSAFEAGRGKKIGMLGRIEVGATPRDIEVAESVKGIVKKQNEFKNIEAIRANIAETSGVIRSGLKQNNAIFNTAQLRSKLSEVKEGSRVTFGTDKTLEGAYDSVVDEFINTLGKKKKNVSELFESRIEFDQIMKRKFGPDILNPAKAGDKVRSNAILDIRRAANDYIAELLPEGNPYKALLKKENLQFDAIKNIAQKAPKVGTTGPQRFLQRHPVVRKVAPYVGGGLVGGGIIEGLRK